jgi:uncharacterized membrane protein YhaH (DUF805 family)
LFLLVHLLISGLLFGVDVWILGSIEEVQQATIGLAAVYGWAVLVPSITVQVRRLHDTNRTGWWMLVSLAPQVAGWVMGWLGVVDTSDPETFLQNMPPEFIAVGVASTIGALLLLVFMCLDGTRGKNRFGPDPKGLQGEDGSEEIWPDVA